MSAASLAARGRRRAERDMRDRATVWYKTGDTVFDEETGRTVPVWLARFSSKCKLQDRTNGAGVRETESGGRLVAVTQREIHFPVAAPAVLPDDEVELTDSLDSQLVGHRFRVLAPTGKSYATARRFIVDEVA